MLDIICHVILVVENGVTLDSDNRLITASLTLAFTLFRYERVPCLEDNWNSLNKPSPLGITSLAGVFIMLGCGLFAAILLLGLEHLFYKYILPKIRLKPKDCFWKSPNLMFFSQVSVFSQPSSLFVLLPEISLSLSFILS